jgi:very-short-patch-repair endonuclease
VVDGLRGAWGSEGIEPAPAWPVLRNAIGGYFDYTGPYFASDDHGCFHGPTSHGCAECMDGYDTLPRKLVVKCCLSAIARSDLIFAWIEDPTAHGTLAELGYAHALGKKILIATPEAPPNFHSFHAAKGFQHMDGRPYQGSPLDELWFTFALATQVAECADPAKAVLGLAADIAAQAADYLPATASEIERPFWEACRRLRLPELDGLVFQHPVAGYFIDFALPDRKIGIELDGFASHSSTADIAKDRKRQRVLEGHGWYITRFGGSEVYHDAEGCVRQAAHLVRVRGGG